MNTVFKLAAGSPTLPQSHSVWVAATGFDSMNPLHCFHRLYSPFWLCTDTLFSSPTLGLSQSWSFLNTALASLHFALKINNTLYVYIIVFTVSNSAYIYSLPSCTKPFSGEGQRLHSHFPDGEPGRMSDRTCQHHGQVQTRARPPDPLPTLHRPPCARDGAWPA